MFSCCVRKPASPVDTLDADLRWKKKNLKQGDNYGKQGDNNGSSESYPPGYVPPVFYIDSGESTAATSESPASRRHCSDNKVGDARHPVGQMLDPNSALQRQWRLNNNKLPSFSAQDRSRRPRMRREDAIIMADRGEGDNRGGENASLGPGYEPLTFETFYSSSSSYGCSNKPPLAVIAPLAKAKAILASLDKAGSDNDDKTKMVENGPKTKTGSEKNKEDNKGHTTTADSNPNPNPRQKHGRTFSTRRPKLTHQMTISSDGAVNFLSSSSLSSSFSSPSSRVGAGIDNEAFSMDDENEQEEEEEDKERLVDLHPTLSGDVHGSAARVENLKKKSPQKDDGESRELQNRVRTKNQGIGAEIGVTSIEEDPEAASQEEEEEVRARDDGELGPEVVDGRPPQRPSVLTLSSTVSGGDGGGGGGGRRRRRRRDGSGASISGGRAENTTVTVKKCVEDINVTTTTNNNNKSKSGSTFNSNINSSGHRFLQVPDTLSSSSLSSASSSCTAHSEDVETAEAGETGAYTMADISQILGSSSERLSDVVNLSNTGSARSRAGASVKKTPPKKPKRKNPPSNASTAVSSDAINQCLMTSPKESPPIVTSSSPAAGGDAASDTAALRDVYCGGDVIPNQDTAAFRDVYCGSDDVIPNLDTIVLLPPASFMDDDVIGQEFAADFESFDEFNGSLV